MNDVLFTEVSVERNAEWLRRNPELERSVFGCGPIPSGPDLSETPYQIHHMVTHPGWQPNHTYTAPVIIFDPDNHIQVLALNNTGCWVILNRHFGDPLLPLALPDDPMALAVIVYGFSVLILPLYCLFALWVMDVPNLVH